MKNLNLVVCIAVLALGLNSCKKDDDTSSTKTTYNVRMTDAPAPYNAVNIDLQSVEVTSNSGAIVVLNVKAGIYNLLNFSNGLDTLIASGELDFASVEQVRLVLGTNSTIVVDNVSYPLATPSAEQSGLKIQVHQVLTAGTSTTILVDFDAANSIVVTGAGSYSLKPVLRTVDVAVTGSITGKVLAVGNAMATVDATAAGVSYTSITNSTGDFTIKGLPTGTYSLVVTPALPLLPVTVTNVSVSAGAAASVGNVQL